jgi:lysophospholipase L1-like esterase
MSVRTILAFGDSLTWGYEAVTARRHAFENRWPNALAAKLGADVRVIAEGLNGRTTVHDDWLVDENRNGSKALPMLLSSHQPLDLVIIMLGSNDMKHPWWSRASDARRGVQRLVEIVQRFQWGMEMQRPEILIMAPPPLVRTELSDFDKLFGHAIKESQFFGKEYKNLADLLDIHFFDAGSVIESDPLDGVHLTRENSRKLGEAVAPIVKTILKLD